MADHGARHRPPGAGMHGGHIVAQGHAPADIMAILTRDRQIYHRRKCRWKSPNAGPPPNHRAPSSHQRARQKIEESLAEIPLGPIHLRTGVSRRRQVDFD